MKFILNPEHLIDVLQNEGLKSVSKKEVEKLKNDFNEIDDQIVFDEANLGPGADWVVILATINSIINVFLIGDKIVKGIEGWVKLGKSIKLLIQNKKVSFIDIEASITLAIEYIANNEKILLLERTNTSEVPLIDLSSAFTDRRSEDFISKPFAYYIHIFKVNNSIVYIIGIRSDGQIREIEKFNITSLYPFRDK